LEAGNISRKAIRSRRVLAALKAVGTKVCKPLSTSDILIVKEALDR